MAKFPLYLLLLLSLLRTNNVLAQACYCTTPWTANSVFGQSCTANADCWACAPNAYPVAWQQAFCGNYQVQICTPESQVTQESCPQGYTGQITKTRTKTCPQNNWTESTVNSCVKSLTNPTNVTSPVSPVSPLNPTATHVSPTVTSTVTAPTIQDVPNSVATQTTSQTKSTASETPTQKETPKTPFALKTIPLALSLELFSKPMTQPNVFPDLNIGQELPNDIKMMQNIYMDLITNGSLFNPDQTDKLKRIASDAVELEQ